jgi:putative pyruvate formate lyase activating enzyme
MHRQVGDLAVADDGIATQGLLVRHLVLPNGLSGSSDIFTFLARDISPHTMVSLMSQYHPAYLASDDPRLGRSITRAEFRHAVDAAEQAGMTRCICQEMP